MKSIFSASLLIVFIFALSSCSGGSGGGNSGYSISGSSLENGSGVPNVIMTISGTTNTTSSTDNNGYFSVSNLSNGNYTITPNKWGYLFSPVSQNVTVNGANITGLNFNITQLPAYNISGSITSGGVAIAGVTVTLTGNGSPTSTLTTDSSGNFIFSSVINGNYLITPSMSSYVFSPKNLSVTINGGNLISNEFTGVSNIQLVQIPAPSTPSACINNCYYVDANNGNDNNNGKTMTTAFKTLNQAAEVVTPGSIVSVMSGTYTSDGTTNPLSIQSSGTSTAWIQFVAAPGQHPIIQIPNGSNAWNGISLAGVSYIVIDGFEIIGQNQSITAQQAASNNGSQPELNGSSSH